MTFRFALRDQGPFLILCACVGILAAGLAATDSIARSADRLDPTNTLSPTPTVRLEALPELAPSAAPTNPKDAVTQANAAARVEPTPDGYVNAMQIWPFSPTELYQLYTKPGRVTDIILQPGEQLVDISGPDAVRWILGNTTTGKGDSERIHISIKPTRPDLSTNLILYTDRRTYYLEVTATPSTWMAAVAWEYPQQHLPSELDPAKQGARSTESISETFPLTRLNFRYEITGPRVPWRPLRTFDDGNKAYIEFPSDIAQHDLPPLFLVDSNGKTELVNYRVQSPYYIVDRLFDVAELRIGDRKANAVRITREGTKP